MAFGAFDVASSAKMHAPEDWAVFGDVFVLAFVAEIIADELFHSKHDEGHGNEK